MIRLLARMFIKNHKDVSNAAVRRAYGMLCSVMGIALNIVLFAGKYAAGVLSGSVAIMADAFNNLSDAGSSLMTLIGFKFAGMKPDRDHPFGHGRIEYVAGLGVAVIILIMGFELAKSSVEKILSPAPVTVSVVSIVILCASILVKLYMFLYNRAVGRKIHSAAMTATAMDSLSDCIATFVALAAMLIGEFTGLAVDGWGGILVSLFIFYAGYNAAKDTLTPLLGTTPDPEFVAEVERIVMSHKVIIGIHDLVVHDYGPGRQFVSLHGEVSGDGDIFVLHDAIDHIERELTEKLGCEAVVHMDPVAMNDETTNILREAIVGDVKTIDPRLTIHDLRCVIGPTHTNVIFDVAVPFDLPLSDAQVKARIGELVSKRFENTYAVINVDKIYV